MFQQYFQDQSPTALPILTMLLFIAVFAAAVLRLALRRPDERAALLPLTDDAGEREEGGHG